MDGEGKNACLYCTNIDEEGVVKLTAIRDGDFCLDDSMVKRIASTVCAGR